jgi:hypothetical protein
VPNEPQRDPAGTAAAAAVDVDEAGVDRAQVRAFLALTPEQRLRRLEEFVESALEIRALNERSPIR